MYQRCMLPRQALMRSLHTQGSFARPSDEKTIIVWDAAKKTEHLVRALTLKGDAGTFGILIPTPTVPTIGKEGDELVDRVGKLFAPAQGTLGSVEVLQRTQLGDFEAVTLKAADGTALGDWLVKNHFADKPALHMWETPYADQGFYVTAVRCTAKGAGDRKLEVQTIRLSFKTDAPFLPYAEEAVDASDEAAYRAKYNTQPQQYRGYTYGTRPFDVYLVADHQMQAMAGKTTGGPPVSDALRVSNESIAAALGDTKAWGSIRKRSRRGW